MGFKLSSILKQFIILVLIMKLGFFSLLGNSIELFSSAYDQKPVIAFHILIIFVAVLISLRLSWLPIETSFLTAHVLLIVAIIAGCFNFMASKSGSISDAISLSAPFIYAIMAIPIYYLLISGKWKFDSLIKLLLLLCSVSYLLRVINAIYWNTYGHFLWSALSTSDDWVGSNGTIRINPPCISLIYVPLSYYCMRSSTAKYRNLYFLCIVLAVFYTFFIHQSRAVLVYDISTICLMYLCEKVPLGEKLGRKLLIIIAVIIALNLPVVQDFIFSFSVNDQLRGGSTVYRINAVTTFGKLFLENPIFGIGVLDSNRASAIGGGHISDIGILGSVYMLGFPLALYFVWIIKQGILAIKYSKKSNSHIYLLAVGIFCAFILKNMTMSCFDLAFDCATPFYIAITEYIYVKCTIDSTDSELTHAVISQQVDGHLTGNMDVF